MFEQPDRHEPAQRTLERTCDATPEEVWTGRLLLGRATELDNLARLLAERGWRRRPPQLRRRRRAALSGWPKPGAGGWAVEGHLASFSRPGLAGAAS
jgi:hypothetical protein